MRPPSLDVPDLLTYFRRCGLITRRDLVITGMEVAEIPRRNSNITIRIGAEGLFVKQATNASTLRSLRRELQFHDVVNGHPGKRSIQRYLASPVHWNKDLGLAAFKLIDSSHSLSMEVRRTQRMPRFAARAVAEFMATLHSGWPSDVQAGLLTGPAPWALAIDMPGLETLSEHSRAAIEMLRLIQSSPELRAGLSELRSTWRSTTLIHQDFKWDNCVIHPAPRAKRLSRLTVVDWEFASWGDPAWDIGCALVEFLRAWLASVPGLPAADITQSLSVASLPLTRFWPTASLMWDCYANRLGLDPAQRSHLLNRSMRCGAARLLQTAFESLMAQTKLTSLAVCQAQLAAHLLRDPDSAAFTLLGLKSQTNVRAQSLKSAP